MPYSVSDVYDSESLTRPIHQGRDAVATGDFGVDEGEVYVGASSATITNWTASEIQFTTPEVISGIHDVHLDCVNYPAIGTPVVIFDSGGDPPTEGETLTADTSGISDANGIASFAYQWMRNGTAAIAGATASTYLIDAVDVGATLRVDVTVTDVNGIVEDTLISAETGEVLAQGGGGANEYQHLFRIDMGVFASAGHRASVATAVDWRGYGLLIAADTPCMRGSRWTGSAWVNTEDDGSTVLPETRRGIQLEIAETNIYTQDENSSGNWSVAGSITWRDPSGLGDVAGTSFTSSSFTYSEIAGYFATGQLTVSSSSDYYYRCLFGKGYMQYATFGWRGYNHSNSSVVTVDGDSWVIASEVPQASTNIHASSCDRVGPNSALVSYVEDSSSYTPRRMAYGASDTPTPVNQFRGPYNPGGVNRIGPEYYAISIILSDQNGSPIQTTGSSVTRARTHMVGDITSMSPISGALSNDQCGQLIVHMTTNLALLPVNATFMAMTDSGGGSSQWLAIQYMGSYTFRLGTGIGYLEATISDPGDVYTLDFRWVVRDDSSSDFWVNGTIRTVSSGAPMPGTYSMPLLAIGQGGTAGPAGAVQTSGVYDQYRLVDEGLPNEDILAW